MKRGNKIGKIRLIKSIVIGIFFLVVTALPARADFWGMSIEATILGQSLSKIQRQIEGVTLAALKTTALSVIQAKVNSIVGGTNSTDSKIISDWQVYLYDTPRNTTKTYMTSYLTSATNGRSSGNYSSDYSSYLQSSAKSNLVTLSDSSIPTTNIEEVVSDPKTSLENGSLLAMDAYWSNPMNNPYGFTLMAQSEEQAKLEQEQQKQFTKSISHGYNSTESNGKVILPGSTIGMIVANSQDMGNKVIASAQSPYELAGGVILSLVNRTVSGLIESGIGSVQANIQREVNNVSNNTGIQVNSISISSGTQSTYTTEVKQQTSASGSSSPASGSSAIPIK
jgi:hypothetical protein